MGEFLITDPATGKKYRVKGDSAQGAVAALRKMLGGGKQAEDVVATTSDGGRVVRMSNGALAFTSPGYATSDPEKVKKIMEGATPVQMAQDMRDQGMLQEAPGLARASKAIQGVPFLGQYADEAVGALSGPVARDNMRNLQGAMDRQNPVQSAALQTAGGIVGSIPAAIAAAPTVVAAAPAALGARVVAGVLGGAAAGGVEGTISGYGRGNSGNRVQTAVGDGIAGTVFGAAAGAAAPVVGELAKRGWQWFKGRDVTVIAKSLNISEDAARTVKAAIENDDLGAAQAALQKAGPNAMLAQSGPGAASMLDVATKASGAAARVASDNIEPAAAAARTRLENVMDAVMGPVNGIRSIARGISSRTSEMRANAYRDAYSSPIDYSMGGAGNAALAVLDRVPPRIMNAAIAKAEEMMRMDPDIEFRQIMASIGPDGKVTFSELPSVLQLDYIKRGIARVAAEEVDNFGRPLDGGALRNLARDLGSAIGEAVPAYRKAVRLGGDKIAEDNALRLGSQLLTRGVTREDVADWLASKPSAEAFDAVRRGIRTQIDEALSSVQRTITDPNTDAREAMLLVKSMSSRANREKVAAILGPSRTEKLFEALDQATSALEARSIVARNSDTFRRTAMEQTMRDVLEVGPLGYLKQGKAGQALQRLVQVLTGATRAADNAQRQQTYAEIARALTTIRGPEAQRALVTMQAAMSGQPITDAQAQQIANALAGAVALGSYQAGTRYLPTQSGAR